MIFTLFTDLSEKGEYGYFLDNERTVNHQALIFGLRELNASENEQYCLHRSTSAMPVTDETFHFISDYQLRVYTSGCYYIDGQGRWKADGLVVSDDHLTSMLP